MVLCFCQGFQSFAAQKRESRKPKISLPDIPAAERMIYLDFFDKIYKTMDEKYYRPVSREIFDKFLHRFDAQLYAQLHKNGQGVKFVKWRSAAYLVDDLKDSGDVFSALIPPKYAEKYEKKVLGKNIDLGIEGKLTSVGFLVTTLEPRADAYMKGMRVKDIILAIDNKEVSSLTEEEIKTFLNPLENTKVMLYYLALATQEKKTIEVISQEYFKQSVFMVPVNVPGIYCLQIQTFNRKTSEDMFVYLSWIEKQQDDKGLILDLRGNPGGPPLAAREISSFFLTPGEDFAYFEGKNQPKAVLDVPKIPEQYHYKAPIVILVNKESGSASELFSGVMQSRGRAILMGTNTAGKVLLKSMFDFEDQSMLLLVTAAGHFPDGRVFSFEGLSVDRKVEEEKADWVNLAALYLSSLKKSE